MLRKRISCPYCKKTLDIRMVDTTLMPFGDPSVTCPYCGRECKTGKNYWCNMTQQEKTEAKAKAIGDAVLKFLVLSVLLWFAGFIIFDNWLGYEPPWWLAALVAAPIVYFVCRWNFNRLKNLKPPAQKDE